MIGAAKRPIRIVVVTTLFPNRVEPRHGIFVAERLRCLLVSGAVEARVVAPVPWFFSTHPRFGRYAGFAAVPRRETYQGITVDHPRYIVVPKIGMTLAPLSMARGAERALAALRADGFDFDLIDAHYFYPDGVAAGRLAQRFDRPFTVTARGSDINVIGRMRRPARQIRAAAARAGALITVSRALADRLESMGVDPRKITTLRNGVDTQRFAPTDREAARARVDVGGPVWICVGHLIAIKGMHLAIDALVDAPDVTLVLVGDGPEKAALEARAAELGVEARVRFAGTLAQDMLPDYFSAADVLIHAASIEGMPNVLLEALACGCAVIATSVGGIPEIITGLPAGLLMSERNASSIIECWHSLRAQAGTDAAARAARRRYAEQFGWEMTTRGQLAIFSRLTGIGQDTTQRGAAAPDAI